MEGPLYFIILNLAAAALACKLGTTLATGQGHLTQTMAGVFSFALLTTACVALLGLAGCLAPGAAALILVTAAAAVMVLGRPQAPAPPGGPWSDPPAWPTRAGAAVLAAFAAAMMARAVFLGASYVSDDLTYHAPAAASWLIAQKIFLAPVTYQAYYPMNAELFSLWFLLPFHADAWVSLAGPVWAAAAALAIAVLARKQGASPGAAAGAAGLFLGLLPALDNAGTFSANELAATAAALCALAFAAQDKQRPSLLPALASGLAAGFALGCKPSYAPIALVLFFHVLHKSGARRAALFCAAAAVTGSGFYLRNLILAGNPLFPAGLAPLAGPLSGEFLDQTRLISFLRESPFDPGMWWTLKAYLNWPALPALFIAIGFGRALIALFTRKPAGPAYLVLASGALMALSFPWLPFSGAYNEPDPVLRVIPRYLIAPAALGLALAAPRLETKTKSGKILFVLFALAALDELRSLAAREDPRLAALAAAAGAGAFLALPRLRAVRHRRRLAIAGAGLVLLMAAYAPTKQNLNDREFFAQGMPGQPIGKAWERIDRLPPGSRVAWFGPAAYRHYPMFGRRLQLVPVFVNRDGTAARPLHLVFREPGFSWTNQDPSRDLSRLVENLRAQNIDFVFVTAWDQGKWPPQEKVLEKAAGAEPVYNDGGSAIWKLK